jgi:hypothetical protein
LICVEAAVLQTELADVERINLINCFNDTENTLMVLIIMYQMFA